MMCITTTLMMSLQDLRNSTMKPPSNSMPYEGNCLCRKNYGKRFVDAIKDIRDV